MATDREELEALRRLAELEARSGGAPVQARSVPAQGSAQTSDFARLITGAAKPEPVPAGKRLSELTTAQRASLTPQQRTAMLDQEEANRQTALGRTGDFGAVTNYFDALQHHGLNAVQGLAQLGVHGLESAGIVPRGTSASDDRAMAEREAAYQQRTAGSGSSYAGAAIGEVAPWLTGVGELRAAGLLPKLPALRNVAGAGAKARNIAAKIGLLAGEGALMGAATPVTEGGDYAASKTGQVVTGALAAPVTQGLLQIPGAAYRGVKSAVRPFTASGREMAAGRELAETFGSDPQTLAALNAPGPAGYLPTAAQALKTPEAIQAERALRNNPATAAEFARTNAENNARLMAEAEGIAGTPQARKAAMDTRALATDPIFKQLESGRVDPLPALKALDSLERSGLGQGDRVAAAIAKLRSKIQSQIENGTINAGVLSGIRETASSYLGPMATKAEKKALVPVRDSIVDALDAAIPGYRDTVAAYGRLSQPLSDMAAGESLLASMRKGGLDTLGGEAPSLNAVEAILAKDAKAKYPMSQAARQRVEAIRDALKQRSISSNPIAATGPATTADAAALLEKLQGGLLERAVRSVPAVGPLLAEVPGLLRKDATRRAGTKAASAKETAAAIEAYNRRLTQPQQGLLSQYGMPAFLLPYIEQ